MPLTAISLSAANAAVQPAEMKQLPGTPSSFDLSTRSLTANTTLQTVYSATIIYSAETSGKKKRVSSDAIAADVRNVIDSLDIRRIFM